MKGSPPGTVQYMKTFAGTRPEGPIAQQPGFGGGRALVFVSMPERHAGDDLGAAHTRSCPVDLAVAYRRLSILTANRGACYGVVDEHLN